MFEVPETRYARNGDVSIAYQVFGDGPNLLAVPPAAQNIDVAWESRQIRHMLQTLGSFSRYVHFDKRGTGLSDPSLEVASLDERVDDMRAVVDDLGLGPAFVFGVSDGGPMALVYAATYPDRVLGLILQGSAASWVPRPPDHPWGFATDAEWLARYRSSWGTSKSVTLERFAPSLLADEVFRNWWPRYERLAASPAALARVGAMVRDVDVRDILPAVRVPTLILHRKDDGIVPIASARYLAKHIPEAHLVEQEGVDHLGFGGDQEPWLDEIREFVTGTRHRTEPARLLATVLFTDLVDSTGQASQLGDRRWSELLDDHDAISRRLVAAYGGALVKSTGDGILGWFDGPARAVRCAIELRDELRRVGLTCRAGLHAGEIERRADDIAGIAVHIASRVESQARPGEVLVSRTVKDLVVGSRIEFVDRGIHHLKGVDDDWQLLAVTGC